MSALRLGLFGRGRLGSAIAQAARAEVDEVVWQIGRGDPPGERVDVAIDASAAEAVEGHLEWALDSSTALVIGTTGWMVPDLGARVGERIGVFVASNFSLTVALLERLARVLGRYATLDPERDPYLVEHHHRRKADAPSGTARSLARALLESCPRKREWTLGTAGPDQLSVAVVRAGSEMGAHTVGLDSPGETVTLTHRVRSRAVFAQGALAAAQFVHERLGVFGMRDLARSILDPLFSSTGDPS